MTKYRIVQHKHSNYAHYVQKKIFGLFWITVVGDILNWDLEDCKEYIRLQMLKEQHRKEHPKSVVVKEFEF